MNKFEYLKIVVADERITHAELRVLIAFWNYVDNKELCAFPSINMISKASTVSERVVKRCISSLENKGFLITVKKGGGRGSSTARRLSLPQHKGCQEIHGLENSDYKYTVSERVTTSAERVTTSAKKGNTKYPLIDQLIDNNNKPLGGRTRAHARETPTPATNPQPTRGTRLPDDWQPSPELIDWTLTQENPHQINYLNDLEEFRDYWKAKNGKDAIKKDWDATWRNWWRRSLKYAERDNKNNNQQYKNQDTLITEMFNNAKQLEQQFNNSIQLNNKNNLDRRIA